jgi:hypothetical protein
LSLRYYWDCGRLARRFGVSTTLPTDYSRCALIAGGSSTQQIEKHLLGTPHARGPSIKLSVSLDALELNPGAARIKTRQRNRQLARDIDLSQEGPGRRLLQTWHVAVGHNVSAEFGKTLK